jgi:hypothetical protein
MPAQEVSQPQVQQMDIPQADAAQQPVCLSRPYRPSFTFEEHCRRMISLTPEQKPVEQMTAEPVSMRGGGEGEEICCGM